METENDVIDIGPLADPGAEPEELTPELILNNSPLKQFLEELKIDPRKYTDRQIIDKIFELSKVVYDQCWDARLPQTVEIMFNQVGMAFTILTRTLMVHQGISVVQGPPQGAPQAPPSGLIHV